MGTGLAPVQLEPQSDPTAGLGALGHESHPMRLFPPEVRGLVFSTPVPSSHWPELGGTGLGGVELLPGQDNHCLEGAQL